MSAESRRAAAQFTFDGVDVSTEVRKYLLSMEYTDYEGEQADDLQIRLEDRDGDWLEHWLGKAADAASGTRATAERETGQRVYFSGTRHYVASNSDRGYKTRPGWATITHTAPGAKHPYHLVHSDNSTNLYGWVDAADVGEAETAAAGEVPFEGSFTITAAIAAQDADGDRILDCGSFELDAIDCSGPPAEITIRGTGLPYKTGLRQTETSRAWEAYNLKGIAQEAAKNGGMSLMYLSERNPYYDRREQYRESTVSFLNRLCQDAGISMKVTGTLLVLFDSAEYERKESTLTLRRGDGQYMDYRLECGKAETQYDACRVSYTDPATGRSIEGVYTLEESANKKEIQQLEVTAKVGSIAEAQALAEKRLKAHNRYSRTAEFTMPGNPALCAGETVTLTGWGSWDGKYLISQARHSVSSGGYTTSISLRTATE